MSPFFSCIVTAFNEGETARVAIESLLAQNFTDFEVLVVHDGVDKVTEEVLLEYQDPRIIHIPQFNDGLSSARNRAIPHSKGEYICFLDADDMRPNWAFESVYETIISSNKPDCVFSPGLLVELRNEVLPFYDQSIFDYFSSLDTKIYTGNFLDDQLSKAFFIEPQSANKFVRKDFVDKYKLRYPIGLFFEDIFFHTGICACMESFAINKLPTFAYFRRYGRPQITGGAGLNRVDAISVAFMTLNYWRKNNRFNNKIASAALLLSLFKLIKWCEESISHMHRYNFEMALNKYIKELDESWMEIISEIDQIEIQRECDWVRNVIEYMRFKISG